MSTLPISLAPFNFKPFWFDREKTTQPSTLPKKLTIKEFITFEEKNPERRFELYNGQVIAMAGASGNHATICMNLSNHIYNHFDNTNALCQVYQSDIRVRINENTIRYPDVLVDCGGVLDMEAKHVILTAEILSKSTAYIDLRQKIDEYKSLATMQEIVIIDQYKPWLQLYQRTGDNWTIQTFTNMSDMVDFKSIDLAVSLEKIYKRVVF